MYELVFDSKALEFLEKLQTKIRLRISNKIFSSKENPLRFFERLEGRKDYKLRVGDYRVIADINMSEKRIEITHVGHRRNIYRQI